MRGPDGRNKSLYQIGSQSQISPSETQLKRIFGKSLRLPDRYYFPFELNTSTASYGSAD
jgi:hypothetical protein